MKKSVLLLVLAFSFTLVFTKCNSGAKSDEKKEEVVEVKKANAELLLEKIVANGDLINNAKVPTLISAADVNKEPAGNIHVIDIRDGKAFSEGHVPGAVNIKMNELIDYMKSLQGQTFQKVVIACYTGQTASYAASILQMMGYDNVYALKYGMCSWNAKFSDRWVKNSTNKLEDKLSTSATPKNEKTKLPDFSTIKQSATDILNERAALIMNEGFAKGSIDIDEIIANPGGYYIVNYWPAALYNLGHLGGSVQYTPKASLGLNTELLTLPTDKTIVVYCFTGQHSAFVVPYLRMLGYDAKSLKYGANGFMHNVMQENEEIGHAFKKSEINNFKFETSVYVEEGEVKAGGC